MRKVAKTLSQETQFSEGHNEEDQHLLNPDTKPEGLGVSLTQLRHLTEVWLKRQSGFYYRSVCWDPSSNRLTITCRKRAKRSLQNWEAFQAWQKRSNQT